MTDTHIRDLTTIDEFRQVVELEKAVWGYTDDRDLVTVPVFIFTVHRGAVLIGGFAPDGRMIGFAYAVVGLKHGKPMLWSHMTGVLPEFRGGLGFRLKLAQRERALALGYDLIEWTFDPLELKNAFFNVERLGAIVRRYVLNQYGTTSSHLHGGLPTDRCVAEWHLDTDWVRRAIEGQRDTPDSPVRIFFPNEIGEIRQTDPARARAVQAQASERFVEFFSQGLAVVGFQRGEHESSYILGKWPSE